MSKKAHYEEPSEKEKKYAKRFLSPDEELELLTGYGTIYLRQKFIVQIILPGAVFIIAAAAYAYVKGANLGYGLFIGLVLAIIFSLIRTWMIDKGHRYMLTSRRLIVKEGLINKIKITSTIYDKITHIEIDQSLADRLFFRHGTIIVNTAGGGDKDTVILHYVEAPVEFKAILEGLVHDERRHLIEESGATNLTPIDGEEVN